MSEQPARGVWRGEAAGIPPARVLVPASVSAPSSSEAAAVPMDAAPPPAPPEDFPLWPTTTTVALHADDAYDAGRTTVLDHLAGRDEQWPPPAMRAMRQARDDRRSSPPRRQRTRRTRRTRPPRGPLAGLTAMLLIALVAGFLAWTSAEPFWLDMGRGVYGTAEVTACKGTGMLRRCVTEFAAPGRSPIGGARLKGVDAAPGDSVRAEMVPGGRIVYAGNPSGLRVRWLAGLGLIMLCGVVLSWLTGTLRFASLRDRTVAWVLTTTAPLGLAAAIVLAAW